MSTDPTPPEDREKAIEEILRKLEEKLRRDLNVDPGSLDEMEDQTQSIGDDFKRLLDEELAKRKGKDQQSQSRSLCTLPCPCGAKARSLGLRTRHIVLLSGVQTFRRVYYHCSGCHRGFAPMDDWLGVGQAQVSHRVAGLLGRLSCYLPDRLVARELSDLFGVVLAVRTVQRYSQRIGASMKTEANHQVEQWKHRNLPPSEERPSRLHITMDGVMLHVDGDWHEAKVGCVYQTDPMGKGIKSRYIATMERSAQFGRHLCVLGHQSGTHRCRDLATVADGAEWIWQEVGKYFPRSVQVLDYYHATEHLWEAARLRFGEGSAKASDWMTQQKERLLNDQVDLVICEVEKWRPRQPQKCVVRKRLVGYLQTHRHRMNYGMLKRAGYHTGSGMVESACKNVVQTRMKRAGMRWSAPGAEAKLQMCRWFSSYQRTSLNQYLQ